MLKEALFKRQLVPFWKLPFWPDKPNQSGTEYVARYSTVSSIQYVARMPETPCTWLQSCCPQLATPPSLDSRQEPSLWSRSHSCHLLMQNFCCQNNIRVGELQEVECTPHQYHSTPRMFTCYMQDACQVASSWTSQRNWKRSCLPPLASTNIVKHLPENICWWVVNGDWSPRCLLVQRHLQTHQ